ncbi:MAG: hypothetical protein J6C40_07700 [Lentisphaeria bacterium]|nr:hypothetical protein [Lentisphaeria bacterium]
MKKQILSAILNCSGILLLLTTPVSAGEKKIFVPERSLKSIILPANIRNVQTVSFAARQGRNCVETSWTNFSNPWSRLEIRRPFAAEEFSALQVSAAVYLPDAAAAGDLNLCLQDRTGEVFQFRQMLKPVSGWQNVVYEVETGKKYTRSWGGNTDHKLDLPLTFAGYSFAVKQKKAGSIAFGEVTCRTITPQPGQENGVFTAFTPSLKHGFATPPPELTAKQQVRETVRSGKACLETAWNNFTGPWSRLDMKRDFIGKNFNSCKVYMDVYLSDPSVSNDLNLRVEDRFGEVFQIRQKLKPQAGWQTLVYELDTEKKYPGTWGGSVNHRLDPPLILRGFSFGTKKPAGAIGLGNAVCQITSGPCEIEIITGTKINILRADRKVKPELSFRNYNASELKLSGSCTVKDAAGNIVAEFPVPPKLPPRSAVRLPLPEIKGYGIYYCTLNVDDKIAPPVKRVMSYARMLPSGPVPGKSSGFHFGVHSHAESYTAADQELTALAAGMCGAKVFRMGFCWRQPGEKSPIDWSVGERLMDVFGRQNMEPQIICGGWLPLWAVEKEKPLFRDFGPGRMNHAMYPKLDKWGEWITKFLKHYQGKVRFMEAWNEPDLVYFGNFSVADYNRLQEHFYKTVKKADPNVTVMTGGYALLEMKDARYVISPNYIRETLQGSKGFYDVIAYHGHGPHVAYDGEIRGLNRIRKEVGVADTPWWSNETAISSAVIGERVQAETLFKKLLFCWANGGIGYTWYNIRNKGFDPLSGEDNFGLVTRDFHPKQVYLTYNMLTGTYRNAKYLRTFCDDGGFQLYLFRAANGDYLIPGWNISGSRFRLLALSNISGTVSVIDLFGNSRKVKTSNGLCLIPAGSSPQTIRISGQKAEPIYIPDFLQLPGQAFIRHGMKSTEFSVMLHNPLPHRLNGAIAMKAPRNSTIAPAEQTFSLAPGEKKVMPFKLKLEKDRKGDVSQLNIPGTLSLDGTVLSDFYVELRPVLSMKPDFSPVPDFVLDKGGQILPRFVNEPTNSHLVWRGTDDVSAGIYFASDKKYFRVKVVVKDDIYSQKFHGGEMWKGDSIQVALWLPGQEDMWEFGGSHGNGKPEKWVWWAPQRSNAPIMTQKMKVETFQDAGSNTTVYIMSLPLDLLGVTAEMRGKPFPIGILVNDNDGSIRESSMFLAPGFGGGLRIPDLSPLISF